MYILNRPMPCVPICSVGKLKVEGDTVTTKSQTWADPTRDLGVAPLEATLVYTVQDDKIKGWTWTLSDKSLAKLQAAG